MIEQALMKESFSPVSVTESVAGFKPLVHRTEGKEFPSELIAAYLRWRATEGCHLTTIPGIIHTGWEGYVFGFPQDEQIEILMNAGNDMLNSMAAHARHQSVPMQSIDRALHERTYNSSAVSIIHQAFLSGLTRMRTIGSMGFDPNIGYFGKQSYSVWRRDYEIERARLEEEYNHLHDQASFNRIRQLDWELSDRLGQVRNNNKSISPVYNQQRVRMAEAVKDIMSIHGPDALKLSTSNLQETLLLPSIATDTQPIHPLTPDTPDWMAVLIASPDMGHPLIRSIIE